MIRVREDRVCIELCPVCNHQTSQFLPGDSKASGRRYPLKDYLEYGILVTINTDTRSFLIQTGEKYFQASYAYDTKGLSIWDALRIMRMGYVCSFLHLPERRANDRNGGAVHRRFVFSEDFVGYLRELADLHGPKFWIDSGS